MTSLNNSLGIGDCDEATDFRNCQDRKRLVKSKKTEADATRSARMIRRRAREGGAEYLAGEGS